MGKKEEDLEQKNLQENFLTSIKDIKLEKNILPDEVPEIKEELADNENKLFDDINLDNSFEKLEKDKMDEIDDLFSPFNAKNSTAKLNRNSSNVILHLNNLDEINNKKVSDFNINEKEGNYQQEFSNKNLSTRHKQTFQDIHINIENFVNDFNSHFYEHIFQKFTENIQKIMDEKYSKYIEICKQYNSQIKEMEFLINGEDNDDPHKESITAIVDSLKEEQAHELDRIDDQ